ncbi:hypothetical protein QJQ45_015945 [Haematococcus lacustris]|nr:hypothetical protein QJQ45_015945 [Haematococcus lacustris]
MGPACMQGSTGERIAAFFVGGNPRLKLEEVVHSPGDRFRLQTVSGGVVHLQLAKGKEYPELGYKWVRDKPPKASSSSSRRSSSNTDRTLGKAAKAKPAPQLSRWVDRDCNAALNMQRFGESRWRPLELCWWPEQRALPAKGKEYPGLGYKRLRDKPPKAQQQQQQ